MCLLSMIERASSVCILYVHETGHPEYIIKYPDHDSVFAKSRVADSILPIT